MAKNYTLKPTYTSVAPEGGATDGGEQANGGAETQPVGQPDAAKPLHADDCIRAENEDDDGYDPYSDRVEPAPLFERDPWE